MMLFLIAALEIVREWVARNVPGRPARGGYLR